MKLNVLYESGIAPDAKIISWVNNIYNKVLENAGHNDEYHDGPIPVVVKYENDPGIERTVSGESHNDRIEITISNWPFDNFKTALREILYEEILHYFDPKTHGPLKSTKWGVSNLDTAEKVLESIFSGDYEYYYTRPWEVDAKLGTQGIMRIENWEQQGLSKSDMIKNLKLMQPATLEEKRLKEFGLWRKYLKFLYRYLNS